MRQVTNRILQSRLPPLAVSQRPHLKTLVVKMASLLPPSQPGILGFCRRLLQPAGLLCLWVTVHRVI